MKRIISVMITIAMTLCLGACGEKSDDTAKIYDNFKNHIIQNGIEDNYYIQISRTAEAANVLIEASKTTDDCAFMEYDIRGKLRFFRNDLLTTISYETYYAPEKTKYEWSDLEFDGLNEKYRKVLDELLKSDSEKSIEITKTDNKKMPKKVSIKYNPEELDTKSIFSNSGNFGIVSVKFETNEDYSKFNEVSVNCQYDYNGTIYLYSVTFGEPNKPDDEGKNGQRPEDIENIYKEYTKEISSEISAE